MAQNRAKKPLVNTRAAEIYLRAVELPEAERRTFLAAQIGDNPDLAAEVRDLLDGHDDIDGFLKIPAGDKMTLPKRRPGRRELEIGETLGDFKILGVLGEGGLAKVYLARQISLGRNVALKLSDDVGVEGQIMANLEHDHIVKVFSQDVDRERNVRLTCMQYIPGVTLETVIDAIAARPPLITDGESLVDFLEGLPQTAGSTSDAADGAVLRTYDLLEVALWIGARLAEALAYAHSKGVYHLDVKPSNVLLNGAGRPFLMDFNVSINRESVRSGSLPQLGGTEHYMSPEQWRVMTSPNPQTEAESIDHRADIYSLGIVLGELLSKTPRRQRADGAPRNHTTLLKIASTPKSSVVPLPTSIDGGVRAVLERCTSADRTRRFVTTDELVAALESCLELRSITKALPAPGFSARAAIRHRYFLLAVIGLFPTTLAGIGSWAYQLRQLESLGAGDWESGRFISAGVLALGHLILLLVWRRALATCATDVTARCAPLRARVIGLPSRFFTWMTLFWLPLSQVTPLLWVLEGRSLPQEILGHCLVASALAGLTASGYGVLSTALVGLRVLYPRLWLGGGAIRSAARREIAGVPASLRFAYVLTVLPSTLGILFLLADPGVSLSQALPLLAALALASLLGATFSILGSHRLARTLFPFLGR